ncbi:c-type cytochrome [Pseudomonas sp. NPDC078700]|uniref:c-type cytochrome n=1 Tax=Pseudomonas sp. NPDC078700 TaxID=3364424 RepID=UPI0037CB4878
MQIIQFRLSLAGLFLVLATQGAQAAISCSATETQQGHKLFDTDCSVCHSVQKDAVGMMGPDLFGVVGRQSGSLQGFSYSKAMRDRAKPWDTDSIQTFITQPQALVPGTYMPYMGMDDKAGRKAVACYLSEQT